MATARDGETGHSNGDLQLRALLAGPSGHQASARVTRGHSLMSYGHKGGEAGDAATASAHAGRWWELWEGFCWTKTPMMGRRKGKEHLVEGSYGISSAF